MGKVKTRKVNEKNTFHYMVFIAPFTIVCILISFMVIQYFGERYGFSPVITLHGACMGCTGDESVIVFILILSVSMFIGLLISYFIIKKIKH